MNIDDLVRLQKTALAEADAAATPALLEEVRIKYLGRKGLLPDPLAWGMEMQQENIRVALPDEILNPAGERQKHGLMPAEMPSVQVEVDDGVQSRADQADRLRRSGRW